MTTINEQLENLYTGKWNAIHEALQGVSEKESVLYANPHVIYVDDEEAWTRARLRVMFFGQETRGWEDEDGSDKTIAYLSDMYDRFFNKGECIRYGGHFWNGIGRLRSAFAERFPDVETQFVWSNIIKVGKKGKAGRPSEAMYSQVRQHFHVIPEEVRILQPNVLLFLTGPRYDDAIRFNFGEVAFTPVSPFSGRELAKLSIPGTDFAFRTYHPNYLWRKGINSFFDAILQSITIE
ncbi:MAG: hypothetical protein LBG30_02790 [Odoribacteraceae bacterium]|jgi:hypothetical protein|nr:hypothetical protein [Odoribacteraceae bacterium]